MQRVANRHPSLPPPRQRMRPSSETTKHTKL